jgi:hypothetical protein
VPLGVEELRIVLKLGGLRSAEAYDVHLAVRPSSATVAPLGGIPAQVRSRTVESTIGLVPFVPPIVLAAVHQLVAAGVVALAETAVFLVLVTRWRIQRRTTTRQLVVGVAAASTWAAFALFLLTWTR